MTIVGTTRGNPALNLLGQVDHHAFGLAAVVQGVGVGSAIYRVAARATAQGVIARITDQTVVAVAAFDPIITRSRAHRVTARACVNGVVACISHDGISARMGCNQAGFGGVVEHHIVASAGDDVFNADQGVDVTKTVQGRAGADRDSANGHQRGALVDIDVASLRAQVVGVYAVPTVHGFSADGLEEVVVAAVARHGFRHRRERVGLQGGAT